MVNILALRRETKISQLLKAIPIPDGALPKEVLPGWESVPLNEKLPMYKCPSKVVFSRTAIGKRIWHQHPIKAVATYDPLFLFYNFKYSSLHDPNLNKFFLKPVNEERVLAHSLVDDQRRVICDLKAFNTFRKYLFELFLIKVHQKIKANDEMERFKLRLRKIEQLFQRKFMISIKKGLMRRRDEILAEMAQNRKQRIQYLQTKFRNNIFMHEAHKRLVWQNLRVKAVRRTQFMKRRQSMLREKERRRRIDLILRLREKFRHYQKVLKERKAQNQEEKNKRAVERWHSLLISRENNKTLKELLMQAHEDQTKKNIQARREKLETAMRRTNEKFMQYKADQVRTRYKHFHKDNVKIAMENGIKTMVKKKQRRRRIHKKKMRKLRKSSFSIDSDEFGSEEKLVVISEPKPVESLQDSIQASFYSITESKNSSYMEDELLEEIPSNETALRGLSRHTINAAVDKAFEAYEYLKSIKSNLSVLETAKLIIEAIVETPDSVLPFDEAVLNYARDRARSTMESVKVEVMKELEKIIVLNKDAICGSSDTTVSTKTKSKCVSVMFSEKEEPKSADTSDSKLKSVKERTPTPKTSLVNLVSIVLESENGVTPDIPEESNTLDLIHLSKPQKLLMERNCLLFRKLLKQSLLQRCLAAIDFKQMLVVMKINTDLIGVDREYLIDIVARSIIHLPTEDLQFGSNLRLATNVLTTEILIELRCVLHETRQCKDTTCLSCCTCRM